MCLISTSLSREVGHIDSTAFNGCNLLNAIFVPADNPFFSSLDGILYDKDRSTLIRCPEGYESDIVSILPSVSTLGAYCFSKCLNVVDVVLPKSLKKIEAYAFNDCCNILSLTLGDNISAFDVTAISGWTKEQKIVTGKSFNPVLRYAIKQKLNSLGESEDNRDGCDQYREVFVVTTFESKEEAAQMSRMLVDSNLVASTHLYNLDVFYIWEREFCNEKEVALSCITRGSMYSKVEKFIREHHSYYCPQVVCIPIINTYPEFDDWIYSNTE